jgi:hypothetical protein
MLFDADHLARGSLDRQITDDVDLPADRDSMRYRRNAVRDTGPHRRNPATSDAHRIATPVSMLDASIVTATVACESRRLELAPFLTHGRTTLAPSRSPDVAPKSARSVAAIDFPTLGHDALLISVSHLGTSWREQPERHQRLSFIFNDLHGRTALAASLKLSK